jgi:hypothetical protein
MVILKLEQRYLNLAHITSVSRVGEVVEVVTPYEVVRLRGEDAERLLAAMRRLADTARPLLDWGEAG